MRNTIYPERYVVKSKCVSTSPRTFTEEFYVFDTKTNTGYGSSSSPNRSDVKAWCDHQNQSEYEKKRMEEKL